MDAILQSEAAECGLACLAMVAGHHGHRVGLRELRRRYPLSLKGATLAQLADIAGRMGFMSRPLRLDMDQLSKLQVPCILHWDLNHFVVLHKVRKRSITILDPAFGERTISVDEVSRHFTGIALELNPSATMQQVEAPPSIKLSQLTGRVTGLYRGLALLLLLSIGLQIFVLLGPFFMQWVVDHVLISADRNLLIVLGVGFALALLIQVAIGIVRGWAVVHLSSRMGFQWAGNVFSHMIRLPMDYFEKRNLGDVTSRMGSVQSIQRTLTTSFVEAMIDGLMALVTLIMMLLYSWKLAIVTLLATGVYFTVRTLAFRGLKARTEQNIVAAARLQSHLLETIRGLQSVKVAGREELRRTGYYNLLNESVNRDVELSRYGLAFNGMNQLIFGFERILVICIGSILAMQNVFSVGMLIAYLAYKEQFSVRTAALIDKVVEFRMLRLHFERLSDVVLEEPEDRSSASHGSVFCLPDRLRIDVAGLGFRYAPGEPWIVKGCSFSVEPGQSAAIIGPSGCGKTTLVKLLLGLLTPTEGEIRVGGIPLAQLGADQFRKIVGAVMQDDQLFAGTIGDNIAFEEDEVDESLIRDSARLAAIHDDVAAMPMGYNTLIGDMGSTLSGGQKQRVVLARALYRRPRLLILDEATSHLDVGREQWVNDAVRSLDLTRIIIAHRPETIASADRVLVMSSGTVVEAQLDVRSESLASVGGVA
ncbi:peptidase domain-containing ABC transporter [Stenotrophomonas sp.]|uniref:peptidase domain-containing ABC transporter n=1 Tax=Stenotrophomonas sp. TaxID=69392 RepID=UPI0028989956|nr:peptidase domain-containing ABC transporter [Stenotrophomonas sp.]